MLTRPWRWTTSGKPWSPREILCCQRSYLVRLLILHRQLHNICNLQLVPGTKTVQPNAEVPFFLYAPWIMITPGGMALLSPLIRDYLAYRDNLDKNALTNITHINDILVAENVSLRKWLNVVTTWLYANWWLASLFGTPTMSFHVFIRE